MRYAALLFLVVAFAAGQPASAAPTAATAPTEGAVTSGYAVAYQLNTQHTGSINFPRLKLPLQEIWNVDLGQWPGYPVIAGGKVYVVAGQALIALDGRTGQTLWTQQARSTANWIGATYDAGVVFAVDAYGQMIAVDAATGAVLWQHHIGGENQVSSAPTAFHGLLYIGGGERGGEVHAMRETDGSFVWKAIVLGGDSAPTVTDKAVYVSYDCPNIYKFNAQTGARIWYYGGGCHGGLGSTSVLDGNRLYVATGGTVPTGLILQSSDGTFVGDLSTLMPPALANNTAFIVEPNGLGNLKSNLVAVNALTGAILWNDALGLNDEFFVSPIVITRSTSSGVVFGGTYSGYLNAYDMQTGALLQSIDLGAPVPNFVQLGGLGFSQGLLVVGSGTHLIGLR